MKERENPILMYPEGEVAFSGYKNQGVSALQEMSSTTILAENIKSQSNGFIIFTFESLYLQHQQVCLEIVFLKVRIQMK